MFSEGVFEDAMHQKTNKGHVWTPHHSQFQLSCLSWRRTILTTLFRFAGYSITDK